MAPATSHLHPPIRVSLAFLVVAFTFAIVVTSFDPVASASFNEVRSSAASIGCHANVIDGVLSAWARAGFSSAKPKMNYSLATSGKILAILWADPLLSPPPKNHNNKILWVSRVATMPGSDLRITAQRMIGTKAVGVSAIRSVPGGPGPSIINLPASGCWQVTLRWSGHTDILDLQYAANQ